MRAARESVFIGKILAFVVNMEKPPRRGQTLAERLAIRGAEAKGE